MDRVGDGQAHVDVIVAVDVIEVGEGSFEDDDVAVRLVTDFMHGEIISQQMVQALVEAADGLGHVGGEDIHFQA